MMWYKILDVDPNSDKKTLKKAYSKLIKTIDMDKDAASFMKVRQAYDQGLIYLKQDNKTSETKPVKVQTISHKLVQVSKTSKATRKSTIVPDEVDLFMKDLKNAKALAQQSAVETIKKDLGVATDRLETIICFHELYGLRHTDVLASFVTEHYDFLPLNSPDIVLYFKEIYKNMNEVEKQFFRHNALILCLGIPQIKACDIEKMVSLFDLYTAYIPKWFALVNDHDLPVLDLNALATFEMFTLIFSIREMQYRFYIARHFGPRRSSNIIWENHQNNKALLKLMILFSLDTMSYDLTKPLLDHYKNNVGKDLTYRYLLMAYYLNCGESYDLSVYESLLASFEPHEKMTYCYKLLVFRVASLQDRPSREMLDDLLAVSPDHVYLNLALESPLSYKKETVIDSLPWVNISENSNFDEAIVHLSHIKDICKLSIIGDFNTFVENNTSEDLASFLNSIYGIKDDFSLNAALVETTSHCNEIYKQLYLDHRRLLSMNPLEHESFIADKSEYWHYLYYYLPYMYHEDTNNFNQFNAVALILLSEYQGLINKRQSIKYLYRYGNLYNNILEDLDKMLNTAFVYRHLLLLSHSDFKSYIKWSKDDVIKSRNYFKINKKLWSVKTCTQ